MPASIRYDKAFTSVAIQYGIATWQGDNREAYERLVERIDEYVEQRVQRELNKRITTNSPE